jgi:hypothetical protein
MARKRATAKNVTAVLRRLADWIDTEGGQKEWAQDVNRWLDDLADQDIFGSEGQCDPRGDNRD